MDYRGFFNMVNSQSLSSVEPSEVYRFSDLENTGNSYLVYKIPKGNGKFRSIYHPSHMYAEYLRSLLPDLEMAFKHMPGNRFSYAFETGKNCALHAMQHVGKQYLLKFDLEDFFDYVREGHVSELLGPRYTEICFIDGAPRQGLPTSPMMANIAFSQCDMNINKRMAALDSEHVYTRYADDICISFDDPRLVNEYKSIVESSVSEHGFVLNRKKTKFMSLKGGRLVITGIGVDENGIHATRKTRKKIRAALHQENRSSARGLTQWAQCKLPV